MNTSSAATARPSATTGVASRAALDASRSPDSVSPAPACAAALTPKRPARNAAKLRAPLAAEDPRQPFQQLRTLRLVLRIVEDEKLQLLERWIARRGREVRPARI